MAQPRKEKHGGLWNADAVPALPCGLEQQNDMSHSLTVFDTTEGSSTNAYRMSQATGLWAQGYNEIQELRSRETVCMVMYMYR